MKIFIYYKPIDQPYGGSNQFLKALKKKIEEKNNYADRPENAQALLFNGFPLKAEYLFNEIFELKQKYPEKIIIYRLDGPYYLTRGSKRIDKIISLFNKFFADGIIFQSDWCQEQNKKLFGISSKYESVIHNAADEEIFNNIGKKEFNPKKKIKLIASSWSFNRKKGFEVYRYLDENLDFSKYEMTFVGNSPVEFKNIKVIKPVLSNKLAEILKEHDIYVFASKTEACSNALIEALSCGLPVVTAYGSSNPEIVQCGGELFVNKDDIIKKIEKVTQNFYYYKLKIPEFSMEKVAQKYYEFAQKIYEDEKSGKYRPKQIDFYAKINFCKMKFMIFKWRIFEKIKTLIKKIIIFYNK